ncbi:S8 family serine peptidase [Kribbella sp. NPDC055071]
MVSTPRSRRIGVAAVASITALGLAFSAPAHATTQPQPRPLKAPATAKADQSVTLLTGDRVILSGGDGGRATLVPGPGRKHLAFNSYRLKDHLYVVPSDIQPQIASGKLDRRLFDVTELIKDGYDDKSSKSIPVIVTYGGQAQKRAAAPGATVTHQLPSINGAALKVDKAKAATFLTGTTAARSAAAVDKIWLDGKHKVALDQSVPQIGGPVAWQAGYTGKGISVAVLDTGIDVSHPDLATQVIGAEKNFTDSPDGDHFGHGTHVASTVAGTAAASNGKYKGVAPDAKLYDGKVCDDFGSCSDSALLAGFEWAANEVKAKIVNLSVGGTDLPGVDPLEEAVNRLTAETGTLFVIAAGNDGPGAGTVGSPGSADAALTVGAVDKQDQLADFSSQGPRVGDGAVKPDVTAPGVSIVAAKAKDSIIGEPVGDQYLRLDGTSMATPHVAGAAALLLQEHPTWTATDLKSALMTSAKPAANQTAFQQGAGRIDLTRGIKQTVLAEPASLSFGTASYPHDDDTPVTKTLTYRNLGDQSVTLNLAATFNAPDGTPAPAGAFQLSASTVTVPAGGTASVQATSNTKNDGPNGAYSGRVTATAGDTQVTTAVGTVKEGESYNLTLNVIGPDGKPGTFEGILSGVDNDRFGFIEGGPTVENRLPVGKYLLQASAFVERPDDPDQLDVYTLVQPSIKLTKDTTVVVDFRTAKPIKVTVPKAGASPALAVFGYERAPEENGVGLSSSVLLQDFTGAYSGQIGDETLPGDQMAGYVASQWADAGADGTYTNTPYLYGQINEFAGRFPTGFVRNVRDKELAVVHQQINAASDRIVSVAHFGSGPNGAGGWSADLNFTQPSNTRLLLDAEPASWMHKLNEIVPSTDPNWPFPDDITQLISTATYKAGKKYDERFNAAAFTTAPGYAARSGDALGINTYSLQDADGHRGFTAVDTQSAKLLHDGTVIAEGDYFGGVYVDGLPAGKAKYTLETSQTRPSYAGFTTRTDLSWTFTSAATADETLLPYVGVRYQPKVDKHNIADRTTVTSLPVTVVAQEGATVPKLRTVTVKVSGDDGKTWHDAAVAPTGHGTYKAIFVTPKGAKAISLRAHVVDRDGNVFDETTIGAYPLR